MSVKMKLGSKDIPFVYKGDKLIYPNPIKDGLLLWYDFKGMRNTDVTKEVAKDLSGNGNDGTLTNFNFTEESGYKDNTLVFDGVDDKLTIPELVLDETAMTVMYDGKLYVYEDDKVIKVNKHSEDDSAELEGLEIGGRNLIVNSDDLKLSSSNDNVTVSKVSDGGFDNVLKSETKVAGASSYFTAIFPQVTEKPKVGQQATLSLLIRGIVFEGRPNGLDIYYNSGTKNQSMTGISEEYQWLSVTFDVYSDSPRFHFYPPNFSELYIARAQLEIGTIATDWSPAPEDFQTTSLSPSSLSNLQLYNRPLHKDELLHNAESKGLKKLKPGVVVQDGLVLHYDFSHESNTSEYKDKAFDYSGNGNHGVLNNFNFTEESGYNNNGLKFDGVDDYILSNSFDKDYIDPIKNFNFDFAINQKDITSKGSIILMPFTGQRLSVKNSENTIAVGRYTSHWFGRKTPPLKRGINHFSINVILLEEDEYGLNEPSFLIEMYVNGKLVEDVYASSSDYYSNVASVLTIGWQGTDASQSDNAYLNESLHSLKIYNRPLTPEEITHNYAIEKERFNIIEGEV